MQKHVTSIFDKLGLTAGEDDNRRILAVLTYLRPDAHWRRRVSGTPRRQQTPSRRRPLAGTLETAIPKSRREPIVQSILTLPSAPPTAVVSRP